jgi:hypothetical protein
MGRNGEELAQLVFGMIVYITLLWIAGCVPVAAGLMLTFPALNGLGLLFEGCENAAAVARTMILPPLINGLLCAGVRMGIYCG